MNRVWTSQTTMTSSESPRAPTKTRERQPTENWPYSFIRTETSRLMRQSGSRRSRKLTRYYRMMRSEVSTTSSAEPESTNATTQRTSSGALTLTRYSGTSAASAGSLNSFYEDSAASDFRASRVPRDPRGARIWSMILGSASMMLLME